MLPIHTILHPTDFSGYSGAAFQLACSLARDHGARLIAVHVVVPPIVTFVEGAMLPEPEVDRDELMRQLQRLQIKAPDVTMEFRLLGGAPHIEILAAAKETACDLIVMGTHGRTGLGRMFIGSVAEQIVRKAPCPVLTLKSPLQAETVTQEQNAAAPRYAEVVR